jgi:putative DNA primase/helicase
MIIPGPSDPFGVAATYAEVCTDQGRPLKRWRGDWYVHEDVRWRLIDESDVRADMVRWLFHEETKTRNREGVLVDWKPTREGQVRDALSMLADVCNRPSAMDPTQGVFLADCWLDARMVPKDYSPTVWNTSVTTYRWEIKAACPNTLTWLNDILSEEDVELLRQWCGYLVSGRTDLQKMLVMLGPPRSGKGTLLWLMEELLGPGSTASVAQLGELTKTFGLEPMVGAKLAVMPDVRWASKDAADAVPELLSITGCDSRDVNRKNRKVWRGRLGVRFVAASNDTPSLADASGALAGRMLTITMGKSFLGREDSGLRDTLRAEMPGVLQWAMGGLRDLAAAGRFVEPAASEAAREEVRQAGNPTYLFIEDVCILGPYGWVKLDRLYAAYVAWCSSCGYRALPSHVLSRQLQNTFRGRIQAERRRRPEDGLRERIMLGLTLRADPQYADEPLSADEKPG